MINEDQHTAIEHLAALIKQHLDEDEEYKGMSDDRRQTILMYILIRTIEGGRLIEAIH